MEIKIMTLGIRTQGMRELKPFDAMCISNKTYIQYYCPLWSMHYIYSINTVKFPK